MLSDVAGEAEHRFGSLGSLSATDVAGLIGLAFLGGESVVLLGDEQWGQRVRGWLRSFGAVIRRLEEQPST